MQKQTSNEFIVYINSHEHFQGTVDDFPAQTVGGRMTNRYLVSVMITMQKNRYICINMNDDN